MNTRLVFTAVVACAAVFLLSAPAASAPQEPVLKISAYFSITSSDVFPVLSCEEGLHLSGAGGNLGASKAIADVLTLVKRVDYQSTSLRRLMLQGITMPRVDVHFELFYSDGSVDPLLDLILYDVSIPEIRMTASDGARAVEAVKIQYPRVCWISAPRPGQTYPSPIKQCWNFEANKPFTQPQP